MTLNIPIIAIPILWTAICIAAFFLWPYERSRGDYGFDLIPIAIAVASIIAALIGWIIYLTYLALK